MVVFQHCDIEFVEPTEWVEQVIDISTFAGETVTIEFHMMASTVVNFSGWFIDDVSVLEETGSKAKPWLFLLMPE